MGWFYFCLRRKCCGCELCLPKNCREGAIDAVSGLSHPLDTVWLLDTVGPPMMRLKAREDMI